MTQQDVTEIINERGHCYLDTYVAQAFARASGQPETDVLHVIRRQESISLREERGKGKYARAIERACMLLASGWEQGPGNTLHAVYLVASHEPATAYGLLAWRERNGGQS